MRFSSLSYELAIQGKRKQLWVVFTLAGRMPWEQGKKEIFLRDHWSVTLTNEIGLLYGASLVADSSCTRK